MIDEVIEKIVTRHNQGTLESYAEENWDNATALESLWEWCQLYGIMLYYRCGIRKKENHKVELRKGTMKVKSSRDSFIYAVIEAIALAWLGDFTAIEPQTVTEDTVSDQE